MARIHASFTTAERKAASAAGGSRPGLRILPLNTALIQARTPAELVDLFELLIRWVLTGQIDPRVGNSVGILAGLQLKALALQIDEERIEALESPMEDRRFGRIR